MKTDSYWMDGTARPQFGKIDRHINVDVLIVGGGITGAVAAYLLKRAGMKVALVERDRCAEGDTGSTTAHLTCVTDMRLAKIVKTFGRDHAGAVWDAGIAAIEMIEEIALREGNACGFRRVPGYLHGAPEQTAAEVERELGIEAELAEKMGFEADFVDLVPVFNRPGMRVGGQGVFHPVLFIRMLLEKVDGDGSYVFEHSEVTEISNPPMTAKVGGFEVSCKRVVIATHVPLMGDNSLFSATMFQSKLALYSSYAVGTRMKKGTVPDACFWDTADPYRYLRIDSHPTFDYVIYGGGDHKTGQVTETRQIYGDLETGLRRIVGNHFKIDNCWSGQVVETNDGLPLIGELGTGQFVATGFSGNGMTFGTLSAMMAHDWIVGKKNPWAALFDVHRKKVIGGTWDYIKENLDYPYYFLKDRLRPADQLEDLKRGEGKIVKLKGRRVAAYRDEKGKLHVLSPVCTHLGCYVRWNTAEKTWDCPCHGSRFGVDGKVIAGPAEEGLESKE